MKLSESVVEANGENHNDTIDELSKELADKIKIINDLKQNNNAVTENKGANDKVTVDQVIEETFKDKSLAKSFGQEEMEDDVGQDPASPHKRKVGKDDTGVVEDNMTLNSSLVTELPSKRQRVINPDLPSTCQMLLSANSGDYRVSQTCFL